MSESSIMDSPKFFKKKLRRNELNFAVSKNEVGNAILLMCIQRIWKIEGFHYTTLKKNAQPLYI